LGEFLQDFCPFSEVARKLLKLENLTVFKDEKTYFTNDLPHLLGALQSIIDFYCPNRA
jgi:hypothetical protein